MPLDKKTRPKPRIDACYVQVKLTASSPHQPNEEFSAGRAHYFAPTHNAAAVICSTYQNAQSNGFSHVLDASTVVYTKGQNGERTGVLMALADGCNKSTDEHERQSAALVAKSACDYFATHVDPNDTSIKLANKALTAGQKSLKAKTQDHYVSDSTLGAAAITSNKGSLINIGHGIVIVVDGHTHKVKKLLQPNGQLDKDASRLKIFPITVQELADKANPQLYITQADVTELHPGDLVILASQGISEILPFTLDIKNVTLYEQSKRIQLSNTHSADSDIATEIKAQLTRAEYKVTEQCIDEVLNAVYQKIPHDLNNQPPAYLIAHEFMALILHRSLATRQTKQRFCNSIRSFISSYMAQYGAVLDTHNVESFKKWLLQQPLASTMNNSFTECLQNGDIKEDAPLRALEAYVNIALMQFGDDTSISVAYVLDSAVELVRAMIDYPDNRESLWQELAKLNPTDATIQLIYNKLRSESHINAAQQCDIKHEQQTVGQTIETLSNNRVLSYSALELLDVEVYLLAKIKLSAKSRELLGITSLSKLQAHQKLSSVLLNDQLTVPEIFSLYNQLNAAQFEILNKHYYVEADGFFGKNITYTWSLTLKSLRDNCLNKLREEVGVLCQNRKFDDALTLLHFSLAQPIFNTHRNNTKLTGAFGNTGAIKAIYELIKDVKELAAVPPNNPRSSRSLSVSG